MLKGANWLLLIFAFLFLFEGTKESFHYLMMHGSIQFWSSFLSTLIIGFLLIRSGIRNTLLFNYFTLKEQYSSEDILDDIAF